MISVTASASHASVCATANLRVWWFVCLEESAVMHTCVFYEVQDQALPKPRGKAS